jgi:hypothetical protein
MRNFFYVLFSFLFLSSALAQDKTARLQVIHNAADPAAALVDIYVNDEIFLEDFAFRAATPFVDVPAEVELNIGVAPGNSNSVSDTLKNFPVMLADGETYVAIANGVLDPSPFDPNPDGLDIGFTIFAKDMIREVGTDPMNVDFVVEHGVTDAPTVDVLARGVGQLVDDAAYGDITPYLSVPAQSYILDITPGDDNSTILFSFEADLSGLGGGAAVVFASGFLNPPYSSNPDVYSPGYWKNHPDDWPQDYIEIGGIDYPKSDAIQFMSGGGGDMSYIMFMHLVAAKLNVLIGNESGCVDDVITHSDNWMAEHPVGSGVPANSSAWQTAEEWKDTLDAYNNGHLCAPSDNQKGAAFGLFAALANGDVIELPLWTMEEPMARLQVIHNAADPAAAVVDIYVNGEKFLEDFAFRAATPFVDVPAEVELTIGVAPGDSDDAGDIIATFPVTLADGGKYIVVANGVLGDGFAPNPDGKDIAFTLFATDGAREKAMDMDKVELNILHGSSDAPTVDVIARDVAKLVDDAMYGDFTGYIGVMPDSYILDITPGSDNNTIVASFKTDLSTLKGGAALVFASGFLDPEANNDGPAFGLFVALPSGDVIELPLWTMEEPMARLQVIHNAADPAAAVVDIYVNGEKFLEDFAFRAATPFVDVPAEVELTIGVAPGDSDDAGDIIATFPVTLADGGKYIVVANGVLGDGFAPNPDGKDIAFTLFATDGAREAALENDEVDLKVLHGATDAPAVNILGFGIFIKKAMYGDMTDYISVKARENWLVVFVPPPNLSLVGLYEADLSGLPGGAAFVFASGFVSPQDNQNGSSFGLFAALPDGNVIKLPEVLTSNKMEIVNSIMVANGLEEVVNIDNYDGSQMVKEFELSQNYPNPFNPGTKIRFALPEAVDVSLKVYDLSGRLVAEMMQGMQNAGKYEVEFDGTDLSSGIYLYVLKAGSFKQVKRMILLK